ncbi:MAG: LysM peptidoglycan-binding domain-containing protein [Chloroflexi bacterium]|nr:LysM peptidoglycan-binding domain-containing protein [Chloroflexota bacterium]
MTLARTAAFVLAGMVAFALAACGGGGGDEPGSGKGARVTDPAVVPSSTPIQNPVVYQIRGDTVSTTGAVGTTTPVTTGGGAGGTQKYTVVSGDTCGAIAAKYGITAADLLKVNRTIDAGCTNLHAGDILTIPAPASGATTTTNGSGPTATPRPGGAKTYKVQSGDTCGAIAASYGVDLAKLLAANPTINANCTNLAAGQTVNIP